MPQEPTNNMSGFMSSSRSFILCLVSLFVAIHSTCGECNNICWSDVCEFYLTLSFGKTTDSQAEYGHENHSAHITQTSISGGSCPETLKEENSITGDGRKRSVMLINGEFPGPTLQVKEGVQVLVHVSNYLQTLSTTIHWHGLSMSGSQWMDGVAYVTQCPIPPGQTFTYNFTALPAGTHWYHPHMSNHRQDGLYGLFVVHQTKPSLEEFPMVLSDWNERDGVTDEVTDLRRSVYGKYPDPVSSLINGRGRHASKPGAPLAVFNVKSNQIYKFRLVNAASDLGYEVSVDGHMITVTSWDGADIDPLLVNGFNIFPGERIDFTVNMTQKEGGFWIRAKSLAKHGAHHIHDLSEDHHKSSEQGDDDVSTHFDNVHNNKNTGGVETNHDMKMDGSGTANQRENGTPDPDHKQPEMNIGGTNPQSVLAVLNYGGFTRKDPDSVPVSCAKENKCIIFNCFKEYASKEYKECIQLKDIFSSSDTSFYTESDNVIAEEHFLNVGMISGATIRSREFVNPLSPLYQRYNHSSIDCDKACNDTNRGCACTHNLTLPYGKLIQIVFSNIEHTGVSSGHLHHHGSHAIGHPMHIHGHRFAILDQGYGGAPNKAGEKSTNNPDIHCDTHLCKNPRWSDDKSKTLSVLKRKNPPLKDTIIVPPGGYVVLRIHTNNPGYWLVHCHVMRDQLDGMAMIMGVAPEQVGPAPAYHPVCQAQGFQCANNKCNGESILKDQYNGLRSQSVSWAEMILMSLFCLGAGLLVGSLMTVWCFRCKRKRGYITSFPQHLIM